MIKDMIRVYRTDAVIELLPALTYTSLRSEALGRKQSSLILSWGIYNIEYSWEKAL